MFFCLQQLSLLTLFADINFDVLSFGIAGDGGDY